MAADSPQPVTKSAPGVLAHPGWDWLVKVAAPTAVAFSACCYLAGYVSRSIILDTLGMTAGALDTSVQETVASGYLCILFLVYRDPLFVVTLALTAGIVYLAISIPRARPWMIVLDGIILALQGGMLILGIALYGVFAGQSSAEYQIDKINKALASSCRHNCLRYVTTTGQVWGIPVAASKDRITIVTRLGAMTFESAAVKAIQLPRKTTYRSK